MGASGKLSYSSDGVADPDVAVDGPWNAMSVNADEKAPMDHLVICKVVNGQEGKLVRNFDKLRSHSNEFVKSSAALEARIECALDWRGAEW